MMVNRENYEDACLARFGDAGRFAGFRVHANLIRTLVTDPKMLSTTIGVFGDWGGGKSSIMRMLEADFAGEGYEDVACIYFNGWQFKDTKMPKVPCCVRS